MPDAAKLPDDPRDWTNGEVLQWLQQAGFEYFKEVCYANGFEGKKFLQLTADAFKAGGFDAKKCEELGRAIQDLKRRTGKVKKRVKVRASLAPDLCFVTSSSMSHA